MHAVQMILATAMSAVVVGAPPGDKGAERNAQTLEFRVVAEKSGDAEDPVARLPVEQYRKQLADAGPAAKPDAPCIWKRVRNPVRFFNLRDKKDLENVKTIEAKSTMIVGRRGDEYYVLVLNSDDAKMVRSADGTPAWSLQEVHASASKDRGVYEVFCSLDEPGAERLQTLSKNNIGRHIAICLGDDVVTAPKLIAPIGKEFVVVGRYSDNELETLVEALETFVPKHDWGGDDDGDGQPGGGQSGGEHP